MLKPKEMVRVLMAGPRDQLPAVIDVLYDLKLFHVVESEVEDEVFRLGSPLPQAEEVSESLVKLRSIASVLGVEASEEAPGARAGPDVRRRIAALEVNIREEEESRSRIEELLGDLEHRIEALQPFAELGLDLGYYRGYASLQVFVGRSPRPPEGLEPATEAYELLTAGQVLAAFVPREDADAVRELLARRGFAPLEVPAEEGDPSRMLDDALEERARWEGRLEEVRERLTTLRERYADFVVAAEDHLSREVEKAEAPLLFATSDHSFVAEGWIPADAWDRLEGPVTEVPGTYVGLLEEDAHAEPPVLLQNPKPVQPFELLTNLFSTPSYKEIDPTLALFVIFPIFFALMVGDLGYGVILVLVGGVGVLKVRKNLSMRRFMAILLVAGAVTAVFGTFLYADAFGIPFHPLHEPAHTAELVGEAEAAEGEVTWETFGVHLPVYAAIHKLTDIGDLLILSIVAAFLHLGLGFVIGFANEIRHDKRHALAKAGWFAVLLGLFLTIIARVRWNRIAGFVWDTFFGAVPLAGLEAFGFSIPWVAVVLLAGGGGLMAVMEFLTIGNPVAILEVASLLANMISYTRLAGIAVAKAAIAENLNNAIFSGLIFGGGTGLVAFGFVLLVASQLIVLLLGGLSSGIQALRLNYVEFFMKFFQGNGVPFKPFGARETGTV